MNIFPQNYCRICSEFFCCKACRSQHEEDCHGINPECNICVYGRVALRNPSDSLLDHFAEIHWPLHCILCKRIFTTVEELKQPNVCLTAQIISNSESLDIYTTENYSSPPITNTMHKSILTSSNKNLHPYNNKISLTTSTPMQKSSEQELLHHIPDMITPVDYAEKTDISNHLILVDRTKSSITSAIGQSKSVPDGEPSKRRVTFSDIEIINIHSYSSKNKFEKSPKIKEEFLLDDSKKSDDATDDSPETQYVSTTEDLNETYSTGNELEKLDASDIQKDDSNSAIDFFNQSDSSTNDTEWESALMDTNTTKSDILTPASIKSEPESETDFSVTNSELFSQSLEGDSPEDNSFIDANKNSSPKLNELDSLHNDQTSVEINMNSSKESLLPTSRTEVLQEVELIKPDHLCDNSNSETKVPHKFINMVQPNQCLSDDCHPIKSTIHDSLESSLNINTTSFNKPGIWSSVTNALKNVVTGISGSSCALNCVADETFNTFESHKRVKTDTETSAGESPARKKMKLVHIECRRTIRNVRPSYEIAYGRRNTKTLDKYTQTE